MMHMEKTMGVLRERKDVLSTPLGKQATKRFNAMAKILTEFEMVHHGGWTEMIEEAQNNLHSTLLVRHKEKIMVNLAPVLLELEREIHCMKVLKLSIPERAQNFDTSKMKSNYHQLQQLIKEYEALCNVKHELFEPLFKYHLRKIDRAFSAGLVHITWYSFNIETFMRKVESAMLDLKKFIKQVSSALCRIQLYIYIQH